MSEQNIITRPMKAVDVQKDENDENDLSTINYPVIASPKLDGIRCVRPHGRDPLSSSFKLIANLYVRKTLTQILPDGFDGEIIIPKKDYNDIQSEIMSHYGEPNFEFHAFDYVQEDLMEPFEKRIRSCVEAVNTINSKFIKEVTHVKICNIQEMKEFEEHCLLQGYEGVMVRKIDGYYKCGRSTLNQGLLLKIKRFYEDEGIITGFIERMHNENKQTKNDLGLSKRSSHQDNKIPLDTLGSFILDWNGYELKCGTGIGLTDELRKEYWNKRDLLLGQKLTFKYQKHGMKHVPRIPIFKGIRWD